MAHWDYWDQARDTSRLLEGRRNRPGNGFKPFNSASTRARKPFPGLLLRQLRGPRPHTTTITHIQTPTHRCLKCLGKGVSSSLN
jgi:hypothetical protein